MKKILITGAAGFIGSHLCEKLLALGYHVIGIDDFDPFYSRDQKQRNLSFLHSQKEFSFFELDLSKPGVLHQVNKVDAVIHLAAKAGVRPSIEQPINYLQANLLATNLLLEWMKERQINKFIFASSSSVYGNNESIPFRETDSVDHPISPYAYTKKACELLNYTYHHLYKIDVVNLRFFTVYGPRQRPDLAIHKFFDLIHNNKPICIYGDGGTARDYTYVNDTVQGIVKSLEYIFEGNNVYEIFNLGNNLPVKLLDLVCAIYQVMGKEPLLEFYPMQPGDVAITYADITKSKQKLKYQPNTDLLTGLTAFHEWFKEQKNSTIPIL